MGTSAVLRLPDERESIAIRRAAWSLRGMACVVGLWSVGCATASVNVTQLAGVAKPIERVYVVSDRGPYSRIQAEELSKALVQAFADRTTAQRRMVLTGFELEDDSWVKDSEQFGADAVLLLAPTGGWLNLDAPDGATASTYDGKLIEARSGRTLWVGEIQPAKGSRSASARATAEAVVDSMALARLVRGRAKP